MDVYRLETRIFDWHRDDSEVQNAVDDSLNDRPGYCTLYVHLNLRMVSLERAEHFGQEIETGRFICAKPQRASTQAAQFADREQGFLSKPQQAPGVVHKQITRGRRSNAFAEPVKQRLVDLDLEQLDGRAYGRLCAAKSLPGSRKTLFFGDRPEDLELP
jgi:hypothetical protein